MRDILSTLERWTADGRRIVVATVVQRRGSAPRDAGASLAVADTGEVAGSVTGGCVEPAVIQEARAVLAGEPARIRTYGIADEDAFEVGLSCGGTVVIAVHELDVSLLAPLAAAVAADRPVALTVSLADGALGGQRLVFPDGESDAPVDAAARTLLAVDASAVVEIEGAQVFVEAFAPRPALYVLGAIDHAAALTRVGRLLGYRTTVCDARAVFVTPERFPDADELVVDWPDRFLRAAPIDARTAICVLTHDNRFDVPAIVAALDSPAVYIGAMGSRKTTADREVLLRAEGVGEAQLARLHAPIGLTIGARSPDEVAVAVGAEIVQATSRERARAASGLQVATVPS